ncbi:MAG: pyridoxine 5'-phosphate synthase [Verrucomicrobiae bacterium]|nr:pyridoxine 5'-phosphate synthase [Verrucomicrobiae bacterium]
MKLGVNLDHVATVRQARYRCCRKVPARAEPVMLEALRAAEKAGAHGITLHLREDRRHVQDDDVWMVRRRGRLPFNLEMALHPEIVRIALKVGPEEVCLVPERRQEVTTEGGLDVAGMASALPAAIERFHRKKIRVSLFVAPDPRQLRASAAAGADCVELHTGAFAGAASASARKREARRLVEGARLAHSLGLQVNAGHGLSYDNVKWMRRVPHLDTLNIGHTIVSRAILAGLEQAVREMLRLMR